MGGDDALNAAAPRVAQLQQLKQAFTSLRKILVDLEAQYRDGKIDKAQLKTHKWHAMVLLASLKAGLRDTFIAGDAWKTRVQDQKNVAETHQLKLQNLLYEKDHLVREIRRCKGFHTKEMDQIEFANGDLPISVEQNIHRQHLDQLTQELETRKRMMIQVKEIKAQIDIVEASTQKKQLFLDGLRGQLDGVEDATHGLQSYMRTPVTQTLQLQHDASSQLPVPLFTLFCELESYREASGCQAQMEISIGDAKGLSASGSSAMRNTMKRKFPEALLAGGKISSVSGEDGSSKRQKAPSRSPSMVAQRSSDGAAASSIAMVAVPSRSPSFGRNSSRGSATGGGGVESGEVIDNTAATGQSAGGASGAAVAREVKDAGDDGDHRDLLATLDGDANANADGDDSKKPFNLWECHEKAVLLKLSLCVSEKDEEPPNKKQNEQFTLLFQYFPTAHVVTVEVLAPRQLAVGNHVLTSLFPGDDGLSMPSHTAAYKFIQSASAAEDQEQQEKEVSFPVHKTKCRPYKWAQWICGLHPLVAPASASSSSSWRPEPSIRNTMQQLIARLTSAVQLQTHLAALASGSLPRAHASFARLLATESTNKKTTLCGWKEITTSSPPGQTTLELFSTTKTVPGCRYFQGVYKNATGTYPSIHVVIQVAPEFPVRAPVFRLRPVTGATTSGSMVASPSIVVDNALQEIELEVNTFYNELISKDCGSFLLVHQLRKVQQCLEMLVCNGGKELPRCFGRERRGKDRRPALVVDPMTKEVRHR